MQALVLSVAALACLPLSSSVAPHIVFVLTDDWGWNDVSYHGSPQIRTPNIDQLAAGGVTFNNYYVNPVCSPTRASLMSGRSIIHNGVFTPYGTGQRAEGLNLSYTLLPEVLKRDYGYATYMVGKWHLGYKIEDYLPTSRGFDRYFGYYEGVLDYWNHDNDGYPGHRGLDLHEGGSDLGILPPAPVYNTSGIYSTPLFADKATAWIQEHAATRSKVPMFLYLAFQAAHSGDNKWVQAPSEYIALYEHISPGKTCGNYSATGFGDCTKQAMRKSCAATVTTVDDAMLSVVNTLKGSGMWDNTLLIFSSDNGGPTDNTDHNNMNNFPLRGCKGGYYEGGMRAVGFATGVGISKEEYVNNRFFHVSDWMPSLLTAAKRGATNDPAATHVWVQALGERPVLEGDGMDVWDALSSDQDSPRTELIHVTQAEGSPLEAHAVRVGDMKLLYHPAGTDCSVTHAGWYPPPGKAWDYANFTVVCGEPPSTDPKTLLAQCSADSPCLFNITADPCEHTDLATSLPDIVQQLQARIEHYTTTTVLPWLAFRTALPDPRSDPINFGPSTPDYDGVMAPWMPPAEDKLTYPSNYSGPGY